MKFLVLLISLALLAGCRSPSKTSFDYKTVDTQVRYRSTKDQEVRYKQTEDLLLIEVKSTANEAAVAATAASNESAASAIGTLGAEAIKRIPLTP